MGIPSGEQYEKCKALHAEQNALLQGAKYGTPLMNSTIYITDSPCELCAKQIHATGIIEVVILQNSGRYCTKALHDFQTLGNVVRYLEEKV
jgi:deoxycytidylate deaminase